MLKSLIAKAFADPYGAPSLIRRLFAEHGIGNWRTYAVVLVMMGVSAGCVAGSAYLVGHGINEAYVNRDLPAVVGVSIAIVLLAVLRGLSTYGQTIQLARISNRIVAANQKRLFEKVLQQNLAFFSDRHSSEFSARITWGARSASDTLNTLVTSFGRDAFALIGLLTVMILQNPMLMLLTLIVSPPAILIGRHAAKRVRDIVHSEFSAATNILEVLQETVQGFKIVEAFNLQRLMRERVDANVDNIERLSNKLARASSLSSPLMEALGGIAVALVILLGGYEILVFNAAPGEFISFITAFLLTYEPAKRLARMNMDLNGSLIGVRVLFEFLDLPDPEPRIEDKPAIAVTGGRIEFRDVGFGYQPDRRRCCAVCRLRRSPDASLRWSGPPAAASRRSSVCSCASTSPMRDRSPSTERRSPAYRGNRCATSSPMSDRTRSCSAAASATTSPWGFPVQAGTRLSPPPRRRMRTSSSLRCRAAMIRKSASTA